MQLINDSRGPRVKYREGLRGPKPHLGRFSPRCTPPNQPKLAHKRRKPTKIPATAFPFSFLPPAFLSILQTTTTLPTPLPSATAPSFPTPCAKRNPRPQPPRLASPRRWQWGALRPPPPPPPPPASRRCSSRLIDPPRRDDQDQPPHALYNEPTSTSSSQPRRRSTRLIGLRRRGDQDQPPRALRSEAASTSSQPRRRSARPIGLRRRYDQPPPPPLAVEGDASPASAAPTLRRSARVHLRVRGLPSATSPSTPRRRRRRRSPTAPRPKSIEEKAQEWGKEKAASGVPQEECVLPFLQKGALRKMECLICSKSILPDERMQCSVNHCGVTLHKSCSEKRDGCCPRHICFYCKRRTSRHRVQRTMPVCTECLLKQNRMIDSKDPSSLMICWSIWPSTSEDAGPAKDIKEAFRRLPLPYANQEFDIDSINKHDLGNESEPPPYVHLKCNVYVVKNKCESDATESGCVNCDHDSTCENCSCRSSLVSCSQACRCSVKCSNKPFRREKKIKIVKTEKCGWGAIALETIEKDDFVIEFVGEVIDNAMCEDRLQDMRQRRDQNFYMCKVGKDFVIDATFRGNACRFLNHSCQPNCQLEKWQVKGKTRLGVFASQTIKVGMPLTYNYRFSPSFGPEKECFCGAPNCRGRL